MGEISSRQMQQVEGGRRAGMVSRPAKKAGSSQNESQIRERLTEADMKQKTERQGKGEENHTSKRSYDYE